MNQASITQYPTHTRKDAFALSNEDKKKLIAEKFQEILTILGMDLTDESLKQTPARVAKMYVDEIFSGLDPKNFPNIILHPQKIAIGEVVLVKNISFVSFCEHHFVPMFGKANVAYIPQKNLIGLSKINRIVRYFAKRPQLQERMTAQIVDSLCQVLGAQDVACSITAQHFCVLARGVEDHVSETETHVLQGAFKNDEKRRQEFFGLLPRI